MRLAVVRVFVASLVGLAGCKAQLNADVNVGGKAELESSDLNKPVDQNGLRSVQANAKPAEPALLGARQDLSYKGPSQPTCKCLAVKAGDPGNAAFQWAGKVPEIDRDTQLVIALSSAGVECPDAAAGTASYWGYEVEGSDVVVVVEPAKAGRPIASGAIIPRPMGGQVFVKPSGKGVPFGRPSSGSGERCQVGNLGTPGTNATGVPNSGVRIQTDEGDPTSSKSQAP